MQTRWSLSLVGFHPARSNHHLEMIDGSHKGKDMASGIFSIFFFFFIDDVHLILRSPKCGKKISSQHQIARGRQSEPLAQGRMDTGFQVVYAKSWPDHQNHDRSCDSSHQIVFFSKSSLFTWACVNCGLSFLPRADRSGTRLLLQPICHETWRVAYSEAVFCIAGL